MESLGLKVNRKKLLSSQLKKKLKIIDRIPTEVKLINCKK